MSRVGDSFEYCRCTAKVLLNNLETINEFEKVTQLFSPSLHCALSSHLFYTVDSIEKMA